MAALYGFTYTEVALKYLETAVPAKLRGQIKRKIEQLAVDPSPRKSKKLKGIMEVKEPVWRIRSGDYRILYVVRENEIIILDIDHRKDVYK